METVQTYSFPVDRLLTLGRPSSTWCDYAGLGITADHVPELIRMACDRDLNQPDSESDGVWAPMHAWRALGQLRATAAVEPLLDLLTALTDLYDDWIHEELPDVFAKIGPPAVPPLVDYLMDDLQDEGNRVTIALGLSEIGQAHPEARPDCIARLTRALQQADRNPPSLNGHLVGALMDLQAVETAPIMEAAYAGDHVDELVCGTWEHVRWEMGLGPKPQPLHYRYPIIPLPGADTQSAKQKAKAKAKRKQARAARKRNRRR